MNTEKENNKSPTFNSEKNDEQKIPEIQVSQAKKGEIICKQGKLLNYLDSEHKNEQSSMEEIINKFKININSLVDFNILENYLNKFNANNPETLKTKLLHFKGKSTDLFSKKIQNFKSKMEAKIQLLNQTINKKFACLEADFLQAETNILNNKVEAIDVITVDEILQFFNKKSKPESDLENIIHMVKRNSDQEKIRRNLNDIESMLYCKMLSQGQQIDFNNLKLEDLTKDLDASAAEFKRGIDFEIENSSIYKVNKNKFLLNPKNFVFKKDITDKLQKSYTIDSVFCAFTTYDGRSLVAWGSPSFIVEIYDLVQEKIIKSLTGHTQHIYITRHFFDKVRFKDYLLTTSASKCCKVWDLSDFSNILTISNCHNGTYLYSGLMVFDPSYTESPLVLTVAPNENIKVWNFKKNHISSINSSTDYTYCLNVWYDDMNNKNNIYIINANSKDVKMYDFRTGDLYKSFNTHDHQQTWHMSALVEYIDNKPYLFESDGNGNLCVWNIETQTIFKKVFIKNCNLRGICIWNESILLVAGTDKTIKIINYLTETLEGTLSGHNNILCTIAKIQHPQLGESILSGAIDGKVKLFVYGDNEKNK